MSSRAGREINKLRPLAMSKCLEMAGGVSVIFGEKQRASSGNYQVAMGVSTTKRSAQQSHGREPSSHLVKRGRALYKPAAVGKS